MTKEVAPDPSLMDPTNLRGWRGVATKPGRLEDCCLVVATYRRPGDARGLILALASMTNVPAEVVIVDGSPDDETEKALLGLDTGGAFELLYVRSPKGLTRQRNIGIDVSTKPLVFFLDDDARPLDGYFEEIRRVLVNHPTVAAAGACALNDYDRPIPRRWRIRRALRLVPRCEPFIYNDAGTSSPSGLLKPFSGIRDVDIFPGYAFAVRRTVFDSMRFSAFFEGYSYGEDVEMSLRIRRKWRVVSCGNARVEHHASPGGRPAAFSKGRMEVRNRYFIWKRYSRRASLLNRIRFHLDFLFLFVMDMAWFATRPWKTHYISHAFGLLFGAASCVMFTPEWDESLPYLRYRVKIHAQRDREMP